jgi:hypothetical protein
VDTISFYFYLRLRCIATVSLYSSSCWDGYGSDTHKKIIRVGHCSKRMHVISIHWILFNKRIVSSGIFTMVGDCYMWISQTNGVYLGRWYIIGMRFIYSNMERANRTCHYEYIDDAKDSGTEFDFDSIGSYIFGGGVGGHRMEVYEFLCRRIGWIFRRHVCLL